MALLTLHEDGLWHLDYEIEPVEYWPYTTWVHEAVFEGPRDKFRDLEEHLRNLFNTSGIRVGMENKAAYGVKDYKDRIWYLGFYDFRFTIGMTVSSPDWSKPVRKDASAEPGTFNR